MEAEAAEFLAEGGTVEAGFVGEVGDLALMPIEKVAEKGGFDGVEQSFVGGAGGGIKPTVEDGIQFGGDGRELRIGRMGGDVGWQVAQQDAVMAAKADGVVKRSPEFANVSGPWIGLQSEQGRGGEDDPTAVEGDEEGAQGWNVTAALAERRKI